MSPKLQRRIRRTSLNFRDIQGNILRSYNFAAGIHYFVHVPDRDRGRTLIWDLLPEVTHAVEWTSPPVIALNVALTFSGLNALEVDTATLEALPRAFSEPISERAPRQLGDDLSDWEHDGVGIVDAHVLVLLASNECRQGGDSLRERFPKLACAEDWLKKRLCDRGAYPPVYRQEVETLSDKQREHFGFADGFGQPAVEGMSNNWPGQGTPEPDTGSWRDIQPGEFILGYPNEDGESISDHRAISREASWLLYDGSYMVYRKLYQNVPRFIEVVAAWGEAYARAELVAGRLPAALGRQAAFELMAAKIVGRWRDGRAIELEPGPDRDHDLREKSHPYNDNDFRYGVDPNGFVCPLGAHVRRTNPRDLLGRELQEARRHRIIRRGMPYGPPYEGWDRGIADGEEEVLSEAGDVDRGLIFTCFNADLERQFEVIQGQWTNDGNDFGLGRAQDFLLGTRTKGRMTIEGKPPFFISRDDRMVITRGCEYLLMPGLAALERLAAPLPPAARFEQIPPKEPAATHRIVDTVLKQMNRTYRSARPVRRGQHPKTHALLKADFIVKDVPADLRFGLFAVDKTYKAWIRFSASRSDVQSDSVADAQGVAIKVLGVEGEKILPEERCASTQDFVLVNHPVFFLRNAAETAAFARWITAKGALRNAQIQASAFFLSRRNPRGLWTLRQTVGTRVENPLGVAYWSQTPYALNEWAVKYLVQPERSAGGSATRPNDWDGLEDAIEQTLRPPNAEFSLEFRIQRQANPFSMPVEDPTVRWNESDSEFRKVAWIRIAHQDFTDQHRRNEAENMSFTPWHSLPEHRPLGGINRVRRAMYEASSEFRHHLNQAPRCEPGGPIDNCPPRMMDWVNCCARPGARQPCAGADGDAEAKLA